MDTRFFEDNLVIVTENVDGKIYMIKAKYIMDVLDDWKGDCNIVPENDARVFLVVYNGKPVNPYNYTDFESVIRYLESLIK